MLRKAAHIFTAFLLLTLTTGFSISKHYCGSHLVSVAVDKEAQSCCNMNDGCCHTETTVYQLIKTYVTSPSEEISHPVQLNLLFAITLIGNLFTPTQSVEPVIHYYSSPPPGSVSVILSKLQTYLC